MVDAQVAAEWACTVLGLKPKPLPVRSGPSSKGHAPTPRA
jgi:hypothetical protein